MEDQRPSWEESKKKDDEASEAKPAPSEGLFAILAKMQEEETRRHKEESEEDDDDEESDKDSKKSGRFRKLLSRIFGHIAPVEEQKPPEEVAETKPAETLEWSPSGSEHQVIQEDLEQRQAIEAQEERPSYPAEDSDEDSAEKIEDANTQEPQITSKEQKSEIPVIPTESPLIPDEQLHPELQQAFVSPIPSSERSEDREPENTTRDKVIIDRQTAWGPALIVDQLARRRDRKLKREDRRLQHQIHELNNQHIEANRVSQRRERFEQVAKNQFETVRAQQQNIERRIEPIEQASPAVEKQTEAMERVAEKQAEAPRIPEITPEVAPVVVLQEVETAAEKNVPIEAALEKRHEVKDENSQGQHYGAAQVGQILADLHQRTTQQHTAFSKAFENQSKQTGKLSSVTYKQAATSGFWAGVVIVAVLIMIGLVV